MLINRFAKMFHVNKRSIDYWTSIGLIHPKILDSGYRDYDEECEQEVQLIFVALALDRPESLESVVEMLKEMDSHSWMLIREEIRKKQENSIYMYNVAYNAINKHERGLKNA